MTDYAALLEKVEQFLAHPPVHPCLLLIHPDVPQLELAGQYLVEKYGWAQIAVAPRLSQALLEASPRRRPALAPRAFAGIVQAHAPGPVLCRQIDLLFQPELQLDPLRLFRDQSRHTILVALWPGSYAQNLLTYAVPAHAHYQTWHQPELCDYCLISL